MNEHEMLEAELNELRGTARKQEGSIADLQRALHDYKRRNAATHAAIFGLLGFITSSKFIWAMAAIMGGLAIYEVLFKRNV